MASQAAFKCDRALRKIEEGAPEVMDAAWEHWPSPYEMASEPEDAVKRLLVALVAAARSLP